jgi:hypothetical protein
MNTNLKTENFTPVIDLIVELHVKETGCRMFPISRCATDPSVFEPSLVAQGTDHPLARESGLLTPRPELDGLVRNQTGNVVEANGQLFMLESWVQ